MMESFKKNIVWLASYPKSGNTWFRAFLSALLSEETLVNINKLSINQGFASRNTFELATDANSFELFNSEIDQLKPDVIRYLSRENEKPAYIKVHERYRFLPDGNPIIPGECSLAALYFIRNPLDVAVSYAHHDARSIKKIIQRMSTSNYTLGKIGNGGISAYSLDEQLGSWSQHVLDWVNNESIKVEVIRYEDMHLSALETFSRALKAIHLSYNNEDILKAIIACQFEKLKKQEVLEPFIERSPVADNFFRKGKIGSWREQLSNNDVQQIIQHHHKVMYRFNYLTEDGLPIF